MSESLDLVLLNFNRDTLIILNICLAFIMFGVALELKIEHFKTLINAPLNVLIGLLSQILILPVLTLLLLKILDPVPSVALGMILIAACPGGNVSNFFSALSKGNVALSVSMTAISSMGAIIITPFNFTFWSQFHQPAMKLLTEVNIDIYSIVLTIATVLIIPLICGMAFSHYYPLMANRYKKRINQISIGIFSLFIIGAFSANYEHFINHIASVAGVVFVHNASALVSGFGVAVLIGLPRADRKTISIETGIQNSGLALVLIFDFFQGLGGMAIIAAWWGIWHLISGMILSFYWSKK